MGPVNKGLLFCNDLDRLELQYKLSTLLFTQTDMHTETDEDQ